MRLHGLNIVFFDNCTSTVDEQLMDFKNNQKSFQPKTLVIASINIIIKVSIQS